MFSVTSPWLAGSNISLFAARKEGEETPEESQAVTPQYDMIEIIRQVFINRSRINCK